MESKNYSKLRQEYLKVNGEKIYNQLVKSGKISIYLNEIGVQASKYEKEIVNEIIKKSHIREKLRENNSIDFERKKKEIRKIAELIVLETLIYV